MNFDALYCHRSPIFKKIQPPKWRPYLFVLFYRCEAAFCQIRSDIHSVFGGCPFVVGFVIGILGGGVETVRFGAVHREYGTFAIAAEGQAGTAGIPLGECGADDRLVCRGAGDEFKCGLGVEGDGNRGDKSLWVSKEKITQTVDCGRLTVCGQWSTVYFRIHRQQHRRKWGTAIGGDKCPCYGGGVADVDGCFKFDGGFQGFGAILGFEQRLQCAGRADLKVIAFDAERVKAEAL